ncbi:MAG: DNA-binding domain-containing protein [Betaproteobacteria bacterium]
MNATKNLAATESRFQDHILTGNPAIDSEIEGQHGEFRDTRLGIYRDAYRLRLIEVLGNDYEVLRKYLGDEQFDAAARGYLAAHASTFRNVRWFGGKLSAFLRTTPAYAEHPELAELAQFEWTLGLAFDSPDGTIVQFEDVAAVPPPAWPEMRFTPHAALHVVDLQSNAVAIWKDIDSKDTFSVEISDKPVTWAIWRKNHAPFFRSLEEDEAWALKALCAHASFGEICGGLCEWNAQADAAARAAGMLRGWIEEGWIAGLQLV